MPALVEQVIERDCYEVGHGGELYASPTTGTCAPLPPTACGKDAED
jgi:hypothetical protein